MKRKQAQMIQSVLDQWGDIEVFEDPLLRKLVSESIAHRLALSPEYTQDRLNQIHRITDYETCERNS